MRMTRPRTVAAALTAGTALALLLSACQTTPAASGTTLDPGTTVTTEIGVALGATAGALQTAVKVDAVPVTTSALGSLPAGVTALGDAVLLTSDADVQTPANAPLLVGLPIPPGAQRDTLALALLVPADRVDYDLVGTDDGDAYAPGDAWTIVPGQVDDEHDLLVAPLGALPSAGQTVTLVQDPDARSPPLTPQVGAAESQAVTFGFAAHCRGFAALGRGAECTATDEADAAQALEDAFQDITSGQGFKFPYLRMEFVIRSLFPALVAEVNLVVDLKPFHTEDDWDGDCKVDDSGSGVHGRYSFGDRSITVCFGDPVTRVFNAGRTNTMRHEFFHASQYPYTTSATSWFKESTAVTAQDSLASFVRDTGRGVRDVDVAVMGKPQMYMLQDFWIYLGQRYGLALSDLIPFLEAGGDAAAIDQVIASDPTFSGLGGFGDAYWAWAKNQAFEKQVALGGSGFATACGLDLNGGATYALKGGAVPPVLSYTVAAPPNDVQRTLTPLTSTVYRLDFAALSSTDYQVTPRVTSSDPDVRVKFVDDADRGSAGCIGKGESSSRTLTIRAGQDQTWYVLISNAGTDGNAGVTLGFGAATPSVEIVSPSQGSSTPEGDPIEFRAIARGFQGADPSDIRVQWSYQDYRGTTVSLGSTQGDAALSVDTLCDGSYTVTANAFDALHGASASAEVDLTVTQPTTPPASCAPSVAITSPSDGATFALGATVAFQAVLDDDHPETDAPVFPITWRDGGPGGSVLAQNVTSFSTAALAEGAHTIYVAYGTASDAIGLTVVNTSNTAPSATISFPGDPATLDWTSYYDGASGVDIPVSGSGSDAEDASVTLTWSYRVAGAVSWISFGSGTTATWHLPLVSPRQTYELRLVAEDSGGLTGEAVHTVTVIGPPS